MLNNQDRSFLKDLVKLSIQDADDKFWDFVFEISALLIVLGPMEALLASAGNPDDFGRKLINAVGWGSPLIGFAFLWVAYRVKMKKE